MLNVEIEKKKTISLRPNNSIESKLKKLRSLILKQPNIKE
jgi:hypothetical protein